MLSAESAALVRATLPAVAGALDEITTRFYATMFHDRPELLDGMFNRGNQASGARHQALAGSIAAFATALLDDPDTRRDAVLARIAHKHAAVGVTDDQYTIVHKYLSGATAEVLGEAVTPEVAAAWDEVYERPGAEEPDARTGPMGLDGVQLPDRPAVFRCGPLPFIRAVRGQLLAGGVPARRIRYEVFGPDPCLPGTAA